MKTFSQLMAELTPVLEADNAPEGIGGIDSEALDEQTITLKPHGDKGTHYKVVKGVPGHLEKGEIIHDTHVDDLHDMGYTIKHLKEDEEIDESAPDFNAPERTEEEEKKIARGEIHGDYKGHQAAMKKKHNITEGKQLNELSKPLLGRYIKSASIDKSAAAHDIGVENGIGQADGVPDRKYQEERNRLHAKRSGGIQQAVDKITK